jgi:hypothetical protein
VQVSFDRETWLVYRRYSAFEALHVAIRNAVDVMTRTYLTKNFPEKEMGSFFGTFGFVVEKRYARSYIYIYIITYTHKQH